MTSHQPEVGSIKWNPPMSPNLQPYKYRPLLRTKKEYGYSCLGRKLGGNLAEGQRPGLSFQTIGVSVTEGISTDEQEPCHTQQAGMHMTLDRFSHPGVWLIIEDQLVRVRLRLAGVVQTHVTTHPIHGVTVASFWRREKITMAG